jgi:hypothetical protein
MSQMFPSRMKAMVPEVWLLGEACADAGAMGGFPE